MRDSTVLLLLTRRKKCQKVPTDRTFSLLSVAVEFALGTDVFVKSSSAAMRHTDVSGSFAMTASMAATLSSDDDVFGRPLRVRFLFSTECCSSTYLMMYFTVDALTDRRCNRLNELMVLTRDR